MSTVSHSQVLSMAGLVDFQQGAIVSRVIVKGETGNVTLFAFDQNQELSEHTAPFDSLVHVIEGEIEIKISSQPYRLESGEAILMPAGKPHALKAVARSKMLLTMLHA